MHLHIRRARMFFDVLQRFVDDAYDLRRGGMFEYRWWAAVVVGGLETGSRGKAGGRFFERLFSPDFRRYAMLNRIPLNKTTPPVMILYGDDNPPMAPASRNFADALKRAGKSVEVLRVPGETHASLIMDIGNRNDRAGAHVAEFIVRHGA